MQIQIRINEEGALRNQRCAFTDRFTLASELLQNARRAGAVRIEIHHDTEAQVLQVHDDPVQTLASLLQELRLGNYPLLHGKTFQLTVGVGSAPGTSVELVDGAGAATPADAGGCHAGS